MSEVYYIYGLHLEGDERIHYVGCTKDIGRRLSVHKSKPLKSLKSWLNGKENRLRLKVLDKTTIDPKGLEMEWAIKLSKEGHPIKNDRRPRRRTKKEIRAILEQFMIDDHT